MALGPVLGGVPGVIVAVWLVRSIPLEALRVMGPVLDADSCLC